MSTNIPAVTRAAIRRAMAAGLAPLRAEPPMPYSLWAAKNFEMDEESSHMRGLFKPWPFQIGWMDAFSNDEIFEVDVEKAKRVGYTKTIVGFAEYNACHRRRKQAIWQPTDDDRDSFEKSEIAPAFDVCKALESVRRAGRNDDTIKFKRFRGSVLHLLGAKAARNFRRITTAISILDEVDAMDSIIEKTIDPVTGAIGRLEGAPFPKLILGTTPRHKLTSHVRRRVDNADAIMEYLIPCPHCSVLHPLLWGGPDVQFGMKWDNNDPMTVRHHCPHCHEPISQGDYASIWESGQWVSRCGNYTYDHTQKIWLDADGADRRPPRHVAFVRVWTAYSPQRAWSDIIREFIEARKAQKAGDSGPMQGFKNETLADVWEEEFAHTDANVLRKRAETDTNIPLMVVPLGAVKVLMGIDTQADRWECVAWAIGRNGEKWPIDYRVIYGTPAMQSDWFEKLDPVIRTTYRHVNGHEIRIEAIGIDTGGTNWTHQAYNYCRERSHQRVYATKGDGVLGKPIKMRPSLVDVNARGKIIKRGVKLWHICTDTAKDLLHGQLDSVKTPGPGCIHLNRNLPPEFYDQLTAEHRIPVKMAHGYAERWVCPSGHRNEVLDCTVIVLLLEQILGLDNKPESVWRMWESSLDPDLFAERMPEASAEADKPMHESKKTNTTKALAGAPAVTPKPRVHGSDAWSTRL